MGGLWDYIQSGRLLPDVIRWGKHQLTTNPFWQQRIPREQGLRMAVTLGAVVTAIVISGGTLAVPALIGGGMGLGVSYGVQVGANYQYGLRGPQMWSHVNPVALAQGVIYGMASGVVAELIAPLLPSGGVGLSGIVETGLSEFVGGRVVQATMNVASGQAWDANLWDWKDIALDVLPGMAVAGLRTWSVGRAARQADGLVRGGKNANLPSTRPLDDLGDTLAQYDDAGDFLWDHQAKQWRTTADFEFNGEQYAKGQFVSQDVVIGAATHKMREGLNRLEKARWDPDLVRRARDWVDDVASGKRQVIARDFDEYNVVHQEWFRSQGGKFDWGTVNLNTGDVLINRSQVTTGDNLLLTIFHEKMHYLDVDNVRVLDRERLAYRQTTDFARVMEMEYRVLGEENLVNFLRTEGVAELDRLIGKDFIDSFSYNEAAFRRNMQRAGMSEVYINAELVKDRLNSFDRVLGEHHQLVRDYAPLYQKQYGTPIYDSPEYIRKLVPGSHVQTYFEYIEYLRQEGKLAQEFGNP